MTFSLRAVSAALCVLATGESAASAQRRVPTLPDAQTFPLNSPWASAPELRSCEPLTNAPRLGERCWTTVEPRDSTKSHTLLGILIGGVAGGVIAIGANRVINGKCDSENDNLISCETAYGILFGVGAVPGALIGALIGSQIKTPVPAK